MSLPLDLIEKALITGKWNTGINEASASYVVNLAEKVTNAQFRDVLISESTRAVLGTKGADKKVGSLESYLEIKPLQGLTSEENELCLLCIGISCLHAFIQVNWTGPDLDVTPIEILSGSQSDPQIDFTEEELNQIAIKELALGGEPAYHLARAAAFLRLAQLIFSLPYTHCQSPPWWRFRTTFTQERILDEAVPPPSSVVTDLQSVFASFASEKDLAGRLTLEQGLLEHHLGNDKHALDLFVRSARLTGLKYELTGALGKRTKFQQTELSQLVLLAESRNRSIDTSSDEGLKDTPSSCAVPTSTPDSVPIPETLALNDDTLLEQTKFTSSTAGSPGSSLQHIDPSNQPALHPLDQCILLSLCLNVKNMSPTHGLTSEQMAPYVSRVISHPQNWSIHTVALLLRSRLEASRTRTVERSILQLQALVDQMPSADSTVNERLLYFHSLLLPTKWELERELASRFLSLGVVKSALEIFERLEMWEEVIKCWQAIERPEHGLAIVRDLLEGRKQESEAVIMRGKAVSNKRKYSFDSAREAKLWCLLGDLEPANAPQHYSKAWSVSGEKSGRAMRSLGGYHFSRGEYSEAAECLRRSVTINPILSRSWFVLGCACVQLERWDEAREAFGRCVSIDDEDGESWNNLASVLLHLNSTDKGRRNDDERVPTEETESPTRPSSVPFENKVLAFRALKQGLKYSYENWRMWSNYMVIATDVGEYSEAVRAFSRVVEERATKNGVDAVDQEILERLVDVVVRGKSRGAKSPDGIEGLDAEQVSRSLLPRVLNLFEHTILPRVSSQAIFRAYARLLSAQSRWTEALQAYLDAFRAGPAAALQRSANDQSTEAFHTAVNEVEDIVDVLINYGPRAETEAEERASENRRSIEESAASNLSVERRSNTVESTGAGIRWKAQARSIVRTFMARTREAFENDSYWEKLIRLQDDLRTERSND